MSCITQTAGGDFALSTSKKLMLTKDVGMCAAQKLTNRFLLVLGEWFLDTTLGLPYFQLVWVKNPDLRVIQSLFTKIVNSIPGIVSVDSLTVALTPDRKLNVNLTAKANDGTIIVGGEGAQFRVQLP